MSIKLNSGVFLSINLLLSVLLTTLPGAFLQASELEQLYGEWGTENQCSRELITPKGTKYASPFEIHPDWLDTGDVWCRLTWNSVESEPNGVLAYTHALCGEDSVRDYQIRFLLKDNELNIIWNLFYKNGPLKRCDR